jgi:hypothetical protein
LRERERANHSQHDEYILKIRCRNERTKGDVALFIIRVVFEFDEWLFKAKIKVDGLIRRAQASKEVRAEEGEVRVSCFLPVVVPLYYAKSSYYLLPAAYSERIDNSGDRSAVFVPPFPCHFPKV